MESASDATGTLPPTARLTRQLSGVLVDVVLGLAALDEIRDDLDEVLARSFGTSLRDLRILDEDTATVLAAEDHVLGPDEIVTRWRSTLARGRAPRPVAHQNSVLVPAVAGRHLEGMLALRPPVSGEAARKIGRAFGSVLFKIRQARSAEARRREQTVQAERRRTAIDLHDSVSQTLAALGERIEDLIDDAGPEAPASELLVLRRLLTQANDQVRGTIAATLFPQVEQQGLVASLGNLATHFESSMAIPVHVCVAGEPAPDPKRDEALFRVAHEALRNVERHASAETVFVRLTYSSAAVGLTVRDDGGGLGDGHHDPRQQRHLGVDAMAGWVESLGGTFTIGNAEHSGTIVEARVPREG